MAVRAQTQERNRRALLAAAVDLIAAQGYRAATVEAIAARAGLTTGAVYSCFGGKRELFHAAITQYRDRLLSSLSLDLPADRTATDVLHRFGAAMAAAAATADSRSVYLFELELGVLALHDPSFAERLSQDGDPVIDTLAAALMGRSTPTGTVLDARSARRVATSATALARGLVQTSLWLDTPVDANLLADACGTLAALPRRRHDSATSSPIRRGAARS